jgi:regulator of sigma E protease
MSWLLAFAGFALLIILHELGHFAAAKAVGMRVERFSLFFGPLLVKFRRGETEYGIGPIPLGGYVKITGMNPTEELAPEVAHRAYYRQPVWKRVVVIAAGPLVNLVLAFLIFWGYFTVATGEEATRNIGHVNPGSPAVGVLQRGDELLAVDGRRGTLADLRAQISTHRCAGEAKPGCRAETPARLTVRRDGQERTFEVRPAYDAQEKRPLVGFAFATRPVDWGVGRSAKESVNTMWTVTRETVKTVVGIVYSPQARQDVGSVVGGYEATRRAIAFDIGRAVFILGLISLSLAVINLFPFLPLDGGHIFWAVAEKLRGRAIPFATMEKASIVGFMLVMVLFFFGVTNDIERLRSGAFDFR